MGYILSRQDVSCPDGISGPNRIGVALSGSDRIGVATIRSGQDGKIDFSKTFFGMTVPSHGSA